MKKKNLIIISIIIIILVFGGLWYFFGLENNDNNPADNLNQLAVDYPGLSAEIADVEKWQEELKNDPERVETYTTLGIVLKTLADKACDLEVPDCKDFYQAALDNYEDAIALTNRSNTLFMVNAASMAKYLGRYEVAEEYYKEAISVSPGDYSYYVSLAELYEYRMNKSQEDILAVYDEGITRVINPDILEDYKNDYLERVNNGQ